MTDYSTSGLITEVMEKGKAPNVPRTRVLTWLQDAQDSVLGRHRYKFSEQSIEETLSANSSTYEFDCDHQQIFTLALVKDTQVARPEYLSNVEFFDRFPSPESSTAGAPSFYTDYGGELYWDKPLDAAYTLKLKYIASSSRLEDSTDDIPQIPEEFKAILIFGGLAGVEAYRENFDIEALHKRTMEQRAEDMLGRYGLRKMQPGKARTSRRRVILT